MPASPLNLTLMTILFQCPNCNRRFRTEVRHLGKAVICPNPECQRKVPLIESNQVEPSTATIPPARNTSLNTSSSANGRGSASNNGGPKKDTARTPATRTPEPSRRASRVSSEAWRASSGRSLAPAIHSVCRRLPAWRSGVALVLVRLNASSTESTSASVASESAAKRNCSQHIGPNLLTRSLNQERQASRAALLRKRMNRDSLR